MISRFWRWLFGGSSAPSAAPSSPLEERVEVLEDRYNRILRRFDRLQGEFNALNRFAAADDDEEEEEFVGT